MKRKNKQKYRTFYKKMSNLSRQSTLIIGEGIISLIIFEKGYPAMNEYKDEIVKRFDAYTKTSFRHCLYHIRLKYKRISENEIISDISDLNLSVEDSYAFLENKIKVMNFDVVIKNDLLYETMISLEQHQRDVIYLSVCESLSDRKIGEKLNMSRAKVQRIKTNVLKYLKLRMKGEYKNEN